MGAAFLLVSSCFIESVDFCSAEKYANQCKTTKKNHNVFLNCIFCFDKFRAESPGTVGQKNKPNLGHVQVTP